MTAVPTTPPNLASPPARFSPATRPCLLAPTSGAGWRGRTSRVGTPGWRRRRHRAQSRRSPRAGAASRWAGRGPRAESRRGPAEADASGWSRTPRRSAAAVPGAAPIAGGARAPGRTGRRVARWVRRAGLRQACGHRRRRALVQAAAWQRGRDGPGLRAAALAGVGPRAMRPPPARRPSRVPSADLPGQPPAREMGGWRDPAGRRRQRPLRRPSAPGHADTPLLRGEGLERTYRTGPREARAVAGVDVAVRAAGWSPSGPVGLRQDHPAQPAGRPGPAGRRQCAPGRRRGVGAARARPRGAAAPPGRRRLPDVRAGADPVGGRERGCPAAPRRVAGARTGRRG